MKKMFLQFGAGNIGRSLCANIFSSTGYDIVFIDVSPTLVKTLNERGSYTINVIGDISTSRIIGPVRAVLADDTQSVETLVKTADIISTSVGARNLQKVFPVLAKGLEQRYTNVNILICENISNAKNYFIEGLKNNGFTRFENIGLVSSVIEKVVPPVPEVYKKQDELSTISEKYNILMLDKDSILGVFPTSIDIELVSPIDQFYKRKLYIPNLIQSLTSLLSYLEGNTLVSQGLENPKILKFVQMAALESARCLGHRYPKLFYNQIPEEYIRSFLKRLTYTSMNDSVYRGLRDIERKLSVEERFFGPCALYWEEFHEIPEHLTQAVAMYAFLGFWKDEESLIPEDVKTSKEIHSIGIGEYLHRRIGYGLYDNLIDSINKEYVLLLENKAIL